MNGYIETLKADLNDAIEKQEQEQREEFNAGREDALRYAIEMFEKHELSNSHKHGVMQGLPTFDEILCEEFLLNTQDYPKEYHKLFNDKFNRAKRRYDELSGSPSVGKAGGDASVSDGK